jgi:hypothetical protein
MILIASISPVETLTPVGGGSNVQTGRNAKAATVAAFIGCEADWTNVEPFCGRFETSGCIVLNNDIILKYPIVLLKDFRKDIIWYFYKRF